MSESERASNVEHMLCGLRIMFGAGDYDSAVDILKMAITLIKQSITASSDSSLVSNNLLFSTSWLLYFHFLDANSVTARLSSQY